jgi:hypothetical protein
MAAMRLRICFLLALPLGFALLPLSPAAAQGPLVPDGCYEVCATTCLKPFSIPDRWDDTGRPGWPRWSGNLHWDSEKFTDQNGNGLYDEGEPFQDGVDGSQGGGPQDGLYTSESYHPLLTGYIASKDLGELMRFKVANPHEASAPGQLYPNDLCFEGQCTGGAVYRWNIANCNPTLCGPGDWVDTENGNMIGPTMQGLEELIAQDPGAQWDADCECITGSAFGAGKSPRIGLVPLHDPRIPLDSGRMQIQIVKIVAVFFEEVQGRDAMIRFIRAQAPGGARCAPGSGGGGYLYDCPTARAFLRGGDRTTRLGSERPATCVQVEPVREAFRLADLDPGSIVMRLAEGGGESIPGFLDRPDRQKDTDHNGVDEAVACFAKEDLRRLFAAVAGRATVPVTLAGGLLPSDHTTLASWSADLEMEVTGKKPGPDAFVATTPLSGAVRIRFATSQPGAARVRVYDVRGRLVRTLLDAPLLPAGEHEAAWDRRDAAGGPLRRGVYFYRVETAEGVRTGRVAIVG